MKTTFIFSILFFLSFPATSFCRLKGTWRQVFPEENGATPGPRRGHYMCSIGDKRVLMIGGADRAYGRETWLYSYESNTWTKVPFVHELDTYFPTALYNILGQKVVAVACDKLDLNPLPIGVYFLQYNEKGVAKAAKMVRM